jgi:hypothetical protein
VIFSIYYHLTSHRHRLKGNKVNTILIVRVTFFLATWVVMVLTTPLAYACTAFMMTDGENVLVGNNEDSPTPEYGSSRLRAGNTEESILDTITGFPRAA